MKYCTTQYNTSRQDSSMMKFAKGQANHRYKQHTLTQTLNWTDITVFLVTNVTNRATNNDTCPSNNIILAVCFNQIRK